MKTKITKLLVLMFLAIVTVNTQALADEDTSSEDEVTQTSESDTEESSDDVSTDGTEVTEEESDEM